MIFRDWKGLSPAERFWAHVSRSGIDKCWIWCGKRRNGYGLFLVNNKKFYAHRFVLFLYGVDVPKNKCVMHSCDHPSCVNPQHLSVGTMADNCADRDRKGRQVAPRGEQSGRAKLNSNQVEEIRTRFRLGGISRKQLAQEFGVSYSLIVQIISCRIWRHHLLLAGQAGGQIPANLPAKAPDISADTDSSDG